MMTTKLSTRRLRAILKKISKKSDRRKGRTNAQIVDLSVFDVPTTEGSRRAGPITRSMLARVKIRPSRFQPALQNGIAPARNKRSKKNSLPSKLGRSNQLPVAQKIRTAKLVASHQLLPKETSANGAQTNSKPLIENIRDIDFESHRQLTIAPRSAFAHKPRTIDRCEGLITIKANPKPTVTDDDAAMTATLTSIPPWTPLQPQWNPIVAKSGQIYRNGDRQPWFQQSQYRILHRSTDFRPGTIIRALMYEEHFDPQHPSAKTFTSESFLDPDKRPVHCKERQMVVIHSFPNHYVAVPFYSFNGRGLEGKSAAERECFVSIADHRRQIRPASQTSVQLLSEYMVNGINIIHEKSAVAYTYPVVKRKSHRVCIQGYLEPDSTVMLISSFYRHAGGQKLELPSIAYQRLLQQEQEAAHLFQQQQQLAK